MEPRLRSRLALHALDDESGVLMDTNIRIGRISGRCHTDDQRAAVMAMIAERDSVAAIIDEETGRVTIEGQTFGGGRYIEIETWSGLNSHGDQWHGPSWTADFGTEGSAYFADQVLRRFAAATPTGGVDQPEWDTPLSEVIAFLRAHWDGEIDICAPAGREVL